MSTYCGTRDKRDLTVAALLLVLSRQVAMLQEAQDAGRGVRGCVEALLPVDDERRQYWRVVIAFYGLALVDPELAALQRERIDGAGKRFEKILRQEHGGAPSNAAVRAEAQRIVSAIIGVSVYHAFHPVAGSTARRRNQMVSEVCDRPELPA